MGTLAFLLFYAHGCGGTDAPDTADTSEELPQYIEIPAGTFGMGCDPDWSIECQADEQPYHEVTLSAYRIHTTEVPVHDFAACVEASRC